VLRASVASPDPLIYAGDGENDLCPALGLGAGDALLLRRGRGLERLLGERAAKKKKSGGGASSRSLPSYGHPALDAAAAAGRGLAAGLAPGVAVLAWESAAQLAGLVAALAARDE